MSVPDQVTVRIERLVVETEHPVDGFALELALGPAISAVVAERGVPSAWQRDGSVPLAVIDGVAWDGTGGASGLAHALAERLHAGGRNPGGSP